MTLLSDWRESLSRRLRQAVLTHYLVPDSRFGLDPGLVPHLPQRQPITLIDVGAHRGDFAFAIQRHSGIKKALLIEPQPSLAAGLKARFAQPQVQVADLAIADKPGVSTLEILEADSCSSLLTVRPEVGFRDRGIDVRVRERCAVQVTTLDDLLRAERWTDMIDLLKIDTQGTELQVINGGGEVMPRVRLLWIEVSFRSLYEGDVTFGGIHARLSALGLRLYSLHEVFRGADREMLQADALFLGPQAS